MKSYVTAGMSVLAMIVVATIAVWSGEVDPAEAHCQVPCGIYDDAARIRHFREDAATVAKAIKNINDLAGKHDAQALNQAVRWINTKEHHASHIITDVAEYFLTQKVKPVAAGAAGYEQYLKKLADHHALMVAAMKTKQNTDKSYADALIHAIDALAAHYPAGK